MTAPPSFRPDDDAAPIEPEMSAEELAAACEAADVAHALTDDDGAEHRAYLRGVDVGHARGLAEGRGAVVAFLREVLAKQATSTMRYFTRGLIERIEKDGAADPAGVERGRAAAIGDAAAYLRLHSHDHAANIVERHEAELLRAREANRRGGEGR